MADSIDIMKEVVRTVLREEPDLIKTILTECLSVEVDQSLTEQPNGDIQIETDVTLEMDGDEIYSSSDSVTIESYFLVQDSDAHS